MDFENENVTFEGLGDIKKMLVSEIDLIRDIMDVVSMFSGESMLAGVKLLQELETNKS